MAQKQTGSMPEGLQIGDGYIIRFRAIDPTDGSDVSGVVVSNVNITGDELQAPSENTGPYMLVPGPHA